MIDMDDMFFGLFESKNNGGDKLSDLPEELPILALRNLVIFPSNIVPVPIGREKSLTLIKEAEKNNMFFVAVAQKDIEVEEPGEKDLFKYGTIVKVLKTIDLPGRGLTAILEGVERVKFLGLTGDQPYLKGRFEIKPDPRPKRKDKYLEAKISLLKDETIKYFKLAKDMMPDELIAPLKNMKDEWLLVNYVAYNIDIDIDRKQKLLEINSFSKRLDEVLSVLLEKIGMEEIKKDIELKVKKDIDKQQKEYILNQQIKAIQKELGENPIEQEYEELKKKAENKKWPKNVQEHFEKELKKLG